MNDTARDKLIERIAELADQFVYALHDPLDFAEEVIDLVTAARDAEIREALLSDEAVESYVASVKAAMNLEEPEPTDEDSARLAAIFWLDAIGLHGDGTGGQG